MFQVISNFFCKYTCVGSMIDNVNHWLIQLNKLQYVFAWTYLTTLVKLYKGLLLALNLALSKDNSNFATGQYICIGCMIDIVYPGLNRLNKLQRIFHFSGLTTLLEWYNDLLLALNLTLSKCNTNFESGQHICIRSMIESTNTIC